MFSNFFNILKEKSLNKRKWHHWFAWYPIFYRNSIFWLGIIERRYDTHTDKISHYEVVKDLQKRHISFSKDSPWPRMLRDKVVWHYRNLLVK